LTEGWVIYDAEQNTGDNIALAVREGTGYGAKVISIQEIDPSKLPKKCAFFGMFCD